MTAREPGYFWVHRITRDTPAGFIPAKWTGTVWEVPGDKDYRDDEIAVIRPLSAEEVQTLRYVTAEPARLPKKPE